MSVSFDKQLTLDEQSLLAVANANWEIHRINENGEIISKAPPKHFIGRTVELFTSCCRKNKTTSKEKYVEVVQKATKALSERIERVVASQSLLTDEEKEYLTAVVHETYNNHSFYTAKIKLMPGPNEYALMQRLGLQHESGANIEILAPAQENQEAIAQVVAAPVQEQLLPQVVDNTENAVAQVVAAPVQEQLLPNAVDNTEKAIAQQNDEEEKQLTSKIESPKQESSDESEVSVKIESESDSDEKAVVNTSRYNLRPRQPINYTKEKIISID